MYSILKRLSVFVIATTLSFQSLAEPPITSEISQAEKIVVDFYNKVFVQSKNDIRKVAMQYLHKDYIQHNPWVATGREPFIKAFSKVIKNSPASHKTIIKRVITAGDYVVLHVHSYDTAKQNPGKAGVDIFRVEDGKIVEHWDVWQKIPEKMPHNNGMI